MADSSKDMELQSRTVEEIALKEENELEELTQCQNLIDGKRCETKIDGVKDCLGASDGLCGACRKKQTCCQRIVTKLTSEDTQQLLQVAIKFLMQLYQVVIGSMLILFVPQLCNKLTCEELPLAKPIEYGVECPTNEQCCTTAHACTMKENFEVDYPFYLWGLIFNFLAFAAYFGMYIVEVYREEQLISLMDVNSDCNNDGEDVKKRMEALHVDEYLRLKRICRVYKWLLRSSAFMFILNTVCSWKIILTGDYSLGQQTNTTFVTNCMFIGLKIIGVYSTVSTAKNVYLSAYMVLPLQYNDVDPTVILRDMKEHPERHVNTNAATVAARAKAKEAEKDKSKTLKASASAKKISTKGL